MYRNRKIMKAVTVAALALVAGLVPPASAAAAPGTTPGMPAKCYQWPTDRVELAQGAPGGFRTDHIMVTEQSPCRDINVRAVQDVDHRTTCRMVRVVFTNGVATRPRRVCRGWVVLSRNATEGAVYVLEAGGRPASLVVRG